MKVLVVLVHVCGLTFRTTCLLNDLDKAFAQSYVDTKKKYSFNMDSKNEFIG